MVTLYLTYVTRPLSEQLIPEAMSMLTADEIIHRAYGDAAPASAEREESRIESRRVRTIGRCLMPSAGEQVLLWTTRS